MRRFCNRPGAQQARSSPAPMISGPVFPSAWLEQAANLSALQTREPCLLISCWTPRPPAIAGDDARPSRRPDPTEQGPPVPRRSTHGRRDRRSHAPGRRQSPRPGMRGLIVVLWRAGLRVHEALTLAETDLNERRGSLLIRGRVTAVARSGWTLGHGRSWPAGRRVAPDCHRDRCSA